MRKWLLPLAALLAVILVAACGGGDDEAASTQPTETGTTETGPTETMPEFSTIEDGILTVGSDIPFPPFEYREGDELVGFDVSLADEMASRLGLETNWIDASFDTIFTQLASGRFDMVASATTITEEREEIVNFTDAYYLAQQAMTVNAERTPDLTSVDGLAGGDVVAVQKGTTGEIWARENLPEGVELRSFPEAPDTYAALEAGNVTAVIFDEPSAVSEAEERPALEVVETIDTGERYGFGVDPQNEELLAALNSVLAEMIEDGTYATIYASFPGLSPGGSIVATE
jgi:polar amino acid transport system substrate-binding protein